MNHKMPVLTEKQREELIEHCQRIIRQHPPLSQTVAIAQIALAALKGNPVYQERRYQFIGKKQLEYWADIDRSTYGYLPESERRIVYTAPPVPVMQAVTLPGCIDDYHGVGAVMSAEAVIEAILAAGGTVEGE